mmetsp:Transcript_10973/g.22697  ORF Transcript_10973/g.22697 Transcript_10973/m.22697 type:complete len:126 (-) Transcript_10973:24-401(-)
MGAHESSLMLLQTGAGTGPSPHSRPPSAPLYFGHFAMPAGVASAASGSPEPWRSPGSEVLLGAPPLVDLRPDIGAFMASGTATPALGQGGGSRNSADAGPSSAFRLGLGPQTGSQVSSASTMLWM